MSEFERRMSVSPDGMEFQLTVGKNDKSMDFYLAENTEVYSLYELMAIGKGQVDVGMGSVFDAMCSAREREDEDQTIDEIMNPRDRQLEDVINALSLPTDLYISH